MGYHHTSDCCGGGNRMSLIDLHGKFKVQLGWPNMVNPSWHVCGLPQTGFLVNSLVPILSKMRYGCTPHVCFQLLPRRGQPTSNNMGPGAAISNSSSNSQRRRRRRRTLPLRTPPQPPRRCHRARTCKERGEPKGKPRWQRRGARRRKQWGEGGHARQRKSCATGG